MSDAYKNDPRFADVPNLVSARLWIILALAFVSTFLLIRRFSGEPATGGKADFAWTLRDVDGRPVELSKFAGRPIFLNVWATWCGPCMNEMPSIARLAANPKIADVAFVCISTDEEPEPVRAFIAQKNPPMTILMAQGRMPRVFRTDGIPATFIIAPDGRIVRSVIGSDEWDQPQVVEMLEGLVREAK